MADVITLKNGRNEIVFDERSFLDLVDEHMGSEARRWLEEWLGENDDASDYIDDLEKEKKHEENDIDSGSDYSCSMVDGKCGGFGGGAGNSPVCERAVSECGICR